MECVVELAPSVMNGRGAIFWGFCWDYAGGGWSVRARLLEQVGEDPYLWTADVGFISPEAVSKMGREFEVWNGSRERGRCIAKVRRV